MRKLASIQTITNIEPIDGADSIDKATVMGWTCVVKKNEFQVGDRCIFFEIDSVLPEEAWSQFLASKKFRVKTLKLRGVLSQGLALPFSMFDEKLEEKEVGEDVTELLKVKKYEQPEEYKGADSAGNFPFFVPKTDEIRVQSALGVIDELKGFPYYITTKCDGTSCTIYKFKGEFGVCSRNLLLKTNPDSAYFKPVVKLNIEEKLPDGFAIQAELCGPGIQGNKLALSEFKLFVFNLYDINNQQYVNYHDFVDFCLKHNLDRVSDVEVGDFFSYDLNSLLEKAKGKYKGTNNNIEGVVVRSQFQQYSPTLKGRLSFKVLNNDYLLKDEK